MDYHEEFLLEEQYLYKTCDFIRRNLSLEQKAISDEKDQIVFARKDLWENASFKGGFNNVAEANQLLEAIQTKAASYDATHQRIDRYQKSLEAPYFARVDFVEKGYHDAPEKIYIGLATVQDEDSYETYVYDWRAPISSIFYRYEVGDVQYSAPSGVICGNVSLKRQFDIKESKLNYFFDSDVNIVDEMLRAVLSQNTSQTMKSIVETIQRQQDMIIRDTQNELVIVQGVAGSGKTSVALHRVAFLLYEGVSEKLFSNNIIILSPNALFGSYIANVLPELGEENITSITFEGIFSKVMRLSFYKSEFNISSRNDLLEEMLCGKIKSNKIKSNRNFLHQLVTFKFSKEFAVILKRYIYYYARKGIAFTDIYYNKKLIANREELKEFLLNSNKKIPLQKSLELIKQRIWAMIHRERRERLPELRAFAGTFREHIYDAKAFGRLISIKESIRINHQILESITIDPFAIYKQLFSNPALFKQLAHGLDLPDNLDEILSYSVNMLASVPGNPLPYEDTLPLLFFNLMLDGTSLYRDIRQVVVDEAQDYYPLHFEVLKLLFPQARYTIMGDINQTIEKKSDLSIYDEIQDILAKKSSCLMTLNKGFRCSAEINEFSRRFLDDDSNFESFDRHEAPPEILSCTDNDIMADRLIEIVNKYRDAGLSSIGILCKNTEEAKKIYQKIQNRLPVTLLDTSCKKLFSGVMLMPIYMAKGLEFDGAILCGTDDISYSTQFDKKLLYVACTRALHRLAMLYVGKASRYLGV